VAKEKSPKGPESVKKGKENSKRKEGEESREDFKIFRVGVSTAYGLGKSGKRIVSCTCKTESEKGFSCELRKKENQRSPFGEMKGKEKRGGIRQRAAHGIPE